MKQKNEQKPNASTLARRAFLKGGGIAVGATLLGSVGIAESEQALASTNPHTAHSACPATDKAAYRVVDTDILFIGSGYGALTGIAEAIRHGRKIMIVDKGPYRSGGSTGINWCTAPEWFVNPDGSNDLDYKRDPIISTFLNNKKLVKKAKDTDTFYDVMKFYMNEGECFPIRRPNGNLATFMTFPMGSMVGGFPRHIQDQLSTSPQITINDRTMITNILVNDGRCVGAMGVYLPTGEFVVYRANAVIQASGTSSWIVGWNTVAANTGSSPDNTGDLDAAIYRLGGRVGESEFTGPDLLNVGPSGIAFSYNAGLGADMFTARRILDKNHEPFLTKLPKEEFARFEYDRAYFMVVCAKHLAEGYGTPHGGFYLDLSAGSKQGHYPIYYTRSIQLWKDEFGIDVTQPGTYVEVGFDYLEKGGAPVIDENGMTDIPGLFCTRGAGGTQGECGGTLLYCNTRMSSFCVRSALDYLKTAAPPTKIDLSSVAHELNRIHEIRTRTVRSGGLRPHVVRQRIQRACGGTVLSPYRTREAMTAALAELIRIRKDALPRQACADQSTAYNTEWRMAVENYNMIEVAEMSVRASLMREESRGYFRPDFPNKDDANWHCMLAAHLQNGEMAFAKIPLPDELPKS